MKIEDEAAVADFLARYLELCRDTGLAINGSGLRIIEAGSGMSEAYASRNPDRSLALRYVHDLPEPAPSRILPR